MNSPVSKLELVDDYDIEVGCFKRPITEQELEARRNVLLP
jgi:hypothetical protein